MIVISPHLDDAVFSASAKLGPEALVVTVCAGIPDEDVPPSDFDVESGFSSAAEAMRARRQEDRVAAQIGNFQILHLNYLDAAYSDDEPLEAAVEGIVSTARKRDVKLLGPAGIRHPDHKRIAEALPDDAGRYEELPYAYVWPESNETVQVLPPAPWKEQAVRAYASQMRPSTHLAQILTEERFR